MVWIVSAAAFLRLAGIPWGLPASDGWDDDGVAPRNFLVGIALTYAHGSYFTYPPFHMFILAKLTLPGWVLALVKAHSHAQADVIAEFIQVRYMTFFAVVARIVSVAMSVGTIFLVGKMGEAIGGRRAGLCAAAACTLNAALTYYGQVTNLDGPYLFWSTLSLWGWMRAIAEHKPRHMGWAALAAAAAIATKDQAYAVFLVSVPAALLLWFALESWPRENARRVVQTFILSTGIALLALLAVDGAITNPSGFARRVAFLAGPASKEYFLYQDSWQGRHRLLKDLWAYIPRYYPMPAVWLCLLGVCIHLVQRRDQRSLFVAGLLPVLAVVSVTVAFNFAALRSESRFFLPQSVFIAVYIGLAADRLVYAHPAPIRYAARAIVFAIAAVALYRCLGIEAAFIRDPRYDAERWLETNIHHRDKVEAYGLNVYLPRFPAGAAVTRLDRKPLAIRNPLPNVKEIEQPFDSVATRNPDFLVVSAYWVEDYLTQDIAQPGDGRAIPNWRQSIFKETAGHSYFRDLFEGKLPYRLAHTSTYSTGVWPSVESYESLGQTIYLFERIPVAPAP